MPFTWSHFAALIHIVQYLLVGLGAIAGTWLLRDSLRLRAHLRIADRLIAAGMRENDAMRESGCIFWSKPWYKRIFRPYPQEDENLQK